MRLAARTPLEKGQDLMEEISKNYSDASKLALRCEGILEP